MKIPKWTPEAELDLIEIADYISIYNPMRSEKFIDHVRKRCTSLADMPQIGRKKEPQLFDLYFFQSKIMSSFTKLRLMEFLLFAF